MRNTGVDEYYPTKRSFSLLFPRRNLDKIEEKVEKRIWTDGHFGHKNRQGSFHTWLSSTATPRRRLAISGSGGGGSKTHLSAPSTG